MKALENRIPPPLVFFLVAALMWAATWVLPATAIPDGWRWSIAGLLFVLAVLLASSGIGAFRRAKTPLDPVHIDRASTLVTSGIYGFTRNPMYLGLVVAALGMAVLVGAWPMLAAPVAVFLTAQFAHIPFEEAKMRRQFGEAYEAYTRKVRRWI